MKKVWGLLLVVVMSACPNASQHQVASAPTSNAVLGATLTASWILPADNHEHLVPDLSLRARFKSGESRLVEGDLTGTSSTHFSLLQRIRITCGDLRGIITSQNRDDHLGIHPLTQHVRFLFTPRTQGTYECRLFALAKNRRLEVPEPTLTVAPAVTALRIGPPVAGATSWGTKQVVVGPGTPTGTHVTALRSTSVASRAPRVRVFADLQITNCYIVSNACPRYFGYDLSTSGDSILQTQLRVEQTDARGTVCHVARSAAVKTVLGSRVHHIKVPHELSATLDPSCPSTVRVSVDVRWVDGDVFTIEGSDYSVGALMVRGSE